MWGGPKGAMGSGYDQDILYKCKKLSKNKKRTKRSNFIRHECYIKCHCSHIKLYSLNVTPTFTVCGYFYTKMVDWNSYGMNCKTNKIFTIFYFTEINLPLETRIQKIKELHQCNEVVV